MYRNDGTFQKGNCIEMSGTEGVTYTPDLKRFGPLIQCPMGPVLEHWLHWSRAGTATTLLHYPKFIIKKYVGPITLPTFHLTLPISYTFS